MTNVFRNFLIVLLFVCWVILHRKLEYVSFVYFMRKTLLIDVTKLLKLGAYSYLLYVSLV